MTEHRARGWFTFERLVLIGGGVGGLLLILLMYLFANLAGQVRESREGEARLSAQAETYRAQVETLAKQLKQLGETPVTDPTPVPPPDPDAALTVEHVRAIVADELLSYDAELSDAQVDEIARVAALRVPKPKDGVSPSEAQVRAVVEDVVAAACAGDACKGDPGEPGEKGDPGEDAPPVTDAQLDARLAAYCAAQPGGTCEGEAGAKGDLGPAGRGVVGMDCVADDSDAGSHWVITYDREPLTQNVAGPCRIQQQNGPDLFGR